MRKAKRRVVGKRRSPKRARRRSYRRNAFPVGGLVVNPRKRASRRKRTTVHARRRRGGFRRNPASMSIAGFRIPPINQILFAGVGFIAPPILEGFIAGYLPASMQPSPANKMATYGLRIATVIGLTFAVRKFVGQEEAKMTAIGGSVYILSEAVKDFMPGVIPGLGAYRPATMGAYADSSGRSFTTLGGYNNPGTTALDARVSRYNSRFGR